MTCLCHYLGHPLPPQDFFAQLSWGGTHTDSRLLLSALLPRNPFFSKEVQGSQGRDRVPEKKPGAASCPQIAAAAVEIPLQRGWGPKRAGGRQEGWTQGRAGLGSSRTP